MSWSNEEDNKTNVSIAHSACRICSYFIGKTKNMKINRKLKKNSTLFDETIIKISSYISYNSSSQISGWKVFDSCWSKLVLKC